MNTVEKEEEKETQKYTEVTWGEEVSFQDFLLWSVIWSPVTEIWAFL